MGKLDQFKVPKFTDRTIDGLGELRIRHLKAGEMLSALASDDRQMRLKKVVQASVYDGDAPLFASVDEIDEIPWLLYDAISDAAVEVNKISKKEAEKNSETPPSSK
jgi:hypothetical protein